MVVDTVTDPTGIDVVVVLTVSRACKVVSVAVGTVGVWPFTAASHRIQRSVVVSLDQFP